jgi:hypothetical protein
MLQTKQLPRWPMVVGTTATEKSSPSSIADDMRLATPVSTDLSRRSVLPQQPSTTAIAPIRRSHLVQLAAKLESTARNSDLRRARRTR